MSTLAHWLHNRPCGSNETLLLKIQQPAGMDNAGSSSRSGRTPGDVFCWFFAVSKSPATATSEDGTGCSSLQQLQQMRGNTYKIRNH